MHRLVPLLCLLLLPAAAQEVERPTVVGFATLPAETFAPGPPSGVALGEAPIRGAVPPFAAQPVQGISALVRLGGGRYAALSDNGFGSPESSTDYRLCIYIIRVDLRTADGGSGRVSVEERIALADPDGHIPFSLVCGFDPGRPLTGADFDPESLQRAPDGSWWIGDELGPFLLHFAPDGRLLAPPVPLPDPETPGGFLRPADSPEHEERAALRTMAAMREHARRLGVRQEVVCAPWQLLLADGDAATVAPQRLPPVSSELFDVASLHAAGFRVIPWTVNEPARLDALLALGVDGLISDRPDLLYAAVARFDADGDGQPGDLLDEDGCVDPARFEAQGHRGARDLRPENTLPAFEAALDHLMNTLELDCGLSADGVPVISHDPVLDPAKLRRRDGQGLEPAELHTLSAAFLTGELLADGLLERGEQTRDPALSPVSVAFAAAGSIADPYALPRLTDVFAFADFYAAYYGSGPGAEQPRAAARARNAARVRFNVETKSAPFAPEAWVEDLARKVGAAIVGAGLEQRASVQSFHFATLRAVHRSFSNLETVCLFGDFPDTAGSGCNLQDGPGWLGLPWPYRQTMRETPRVPRSGGFEGMALSPDGKTLYPILEKPLVDGARALRIFAFDLAAGAYTGDWWDLPLDERATALCAFQLYAEGRGLVIERDDSEGLLDGYKRVIAVELGAEHAVSRRELLDLNALGNPHDLLGPGLEGDVGRGDPCAFPFHTIESLVVEGPRHLLLANDNNYPFSCGRHTGSGAPDDNELWRIELVTPLF